MSSKYDHKLLSNGWISDWTVSIVIRITNRLPQNLINCSLYHCRAILKLSSEFIQNVLSSDRISDWTVSMVQADKNSENRQTNQDYLKYNLLTKEVIKPNDRQMPCHCAHTLPWVRSIVVTCLVKWWNYSFLSGVWKPDTTSSKLLFNVYASYAYITDQSWLLAFYHISKCYPPLCV